MGMPENEPHHERWSYDHLKQQIMTAFESGKYGVTEYEHLPETIELGPVVMGKLAECRTATDQDGNERAGIVRFDPGSRRLEIKKDLFVGNNHSIIGLPSDYTITTSSVSIIQQNPELARQMQTLYGKTVPELVALLHSDSPQAQLARRFVTREVAILHSHPNTLPFSDMDLTSLLHSPDVKFWLLSKPGDAVDALFTTRTTQWIKIGEESIYQKKWQGMWLASAQKEVGSTQLDESNPAHHAAFQRANEKLVIAVAKNYQLGYYHGSMSGKLQRQR